MPHLYDLNRIAQDFFNSADTLTALVDKLERVVSASDEPVNKRQLRMLYSVRDATLRNYRELTDVIHYLEADRPKSK